MEVNIDSGIIPFRLQREPEPILCRLPLVRCNEIMGAIVARLNAAGTNQDMNHLKEFQAAAKTLSGVEITMDEAANIWEHLDAEFSKKNIAHKQRMDEIAKSPNFTAWTPPAGTTNNDTDTLPISPD